jgi:putative DNA primase/helicase
VGLAAKHLGESRCAEIARTLFTVTLTEEAKGEIHGLCPIHGEKNPSFAYNFKKDVYHCLACGADGDLLRLWSEVKGLGQKEGFKAFCEEFGISLGQGDTEAGNRRRGGVGAADEVVLDPVLVHRRMLEAWEKFLPLPDTYQERLARTRGWSREIMALMDLRLQTQGMDRKTGDLFNLKTAERIAIPIRDSAGDLVNIRRYLPGAQKFKILSWAKSTGSARLYPAAPDPDGIVLLCEGESDTLCAISHGFNAITQTSKLKNWPPNQLADFQDRDVVIAYDADQPGQKYARFAGDSLAIAAKSIRMLQWPSFMGVDESGGVSKDHGQDLTDYFVQHKRTIDDFRKLLDKATPWPPAPVPLSAEPAEDGTLQDENDVLQFFDHGVNKRFSFKPRLLAERIINDIPLLFCEETGETYRWNGKFWEEYSETHVKNAAIKLLRKESQKGRIEDAVFQVKTLVTIPHGRKLNDQEDWICLQNGILNLVSYELRPHDRDAFFTSALPVSFNPDSDDRCERWESFLLETIETAGPIAQLQEFFGYCLVRHVKYEKCLFLLGPGEDGKSKCLNVLKEMLGEINCAAVAFADLEKEFHRSSLYHKMLNISTEIGAQAIESPYFKAITSGDPISAAFKNVDNFTFSPYVKLAFAGNSLPRVRDNSHGYFRRFMPIKFKNQFLEDDPRRDPDLMDKLKGKLSEIFIWSLCGLKRLTDQKRFTNCDETKLLMQQYRRSNNPILCYIEDECVLGPDEVCTTDDLYSDYKTYCGRNGYSPLNKENFFRELYVAQASLKRYRPNNHGERENKVRGIGIVGKFNE